MIRCAFIAVKELSSLHDKHLNRPTLDDSVDEEQTIEITTKEITQVGNNMTRFEKLFIFAVVERSFEKYFISRILCHKLVCKKLCTMFLPFC